MAPKSGLLPAKALWACACALLMAAALHLASAQQPDCIQLGQQMLGACEQERTALAPTYPLSAPAPASAEQFGAALAALDGAGLPGSRCCAAVQEFQAAACEDSSAVAAVLSSIGFTRQGLNSTLAILEGAGACA